MPNSNKILIALLILFLATRFFGFSQVYHQDEYKWAILSSRGEYNPIHPPVASFLFQRAGRLFGFGHLRLVPIILSALVFLLVYFFTQRLYGMTAAKWTAIVLLVSVYNFLANIQIDIDGAILPFFVLLFFYSFYQIDFARSKQKKNYLWGLVFLLALTGGFLTKLSFIIAVAALATEVYLVYRPPLKRLFQALGAIVVVGVGLFLLLGRGEVFNYIHRFDNFSLLDRNYRQVFFLAIKSLILASPLLLGGYLFLLTKPSLWRRYRLWLIFLFYNILFYFVLFDFSHGGTIERYLMFLIIPGATITGSLLADWFRSFSWPRSLSVIPLALILLAIIIWRWLLSLPAMILPLQPKQAYVDKLTQFDFSFLIPITGGSGPSGFYVSAVFITMFFTLTLVGLVAVRIAHCQSWRRIATTTFVVGGIFYNLILGTELINGLQYGNVTSLTRQALAEVVRDKDIPEIITYYDVGGYELRTAGKYRNRFYTDPMFTSNAEKFIAWEGHFLVVDFPEINKDSIYWRYLETCQTKKEWQDKLVKAYVFDCSSGDRTLFQ